MVGSNSAWVKYGISCELPVVVVIHCYFGYAYMLHDIISTISHQPTIYHNIYKSYTIGSLRNCTTVKNQMRLRMENEIPGRKVNERIEDELQPNFTQGSLSSFFCNSKQEC